MDGKHSRIKNKKNSLRIHTCQASLSYKIFWRNNNYIVRISHVQRITNKARQVNNFLNLRQYPLNILIVR